MKETDGSRGRAAGTQSGSSRTGAMGLAMKELLLPVREPFPAKKGDCMAGERSAAAQPLSDRAMAVYGSTAGRARLEMKIRSLI